MRRLLSWISYGLFPVVKGVSLTIEKGEIVSLLGPNGAGNTTLLYAISALIRAKEGEIYLNGDRIDALPSHKVVQKELIHVSEGRKIFSSLTDNENLELESYISSAKKNRGKYIRCVFELFPRLADRKDQKAGTLSGGEQQMPAIARGIMAQPQLLILDS